MEKESGNTSMVKQYIFGYGSLINDKSRNSTAPTEDPIPVEVINLERSWSVAATKERYTAVGVVEKEDAFCNGVLFEVDNEALGRFDEREKHYTRIEVPLTSVLPLDPSVEVSGIVWTYVIEDPHQASQAVPIRQSYLDVMLMGALNISEKFAQGVVISTEGWNGTWVNDRQNPLPLRPPADRLTQTAIDKLLSDLIPDEFAFRIEW